MEARERAPKRALLTGAKFTKFDAPGCDITDPGRVNDNRVINQSAATITLPYPQRARIRADHPTAFSIYSNALASAP